MRIDVASAPPLPRSAYDALRVALQERCVLIDGAEADVLRRSVRAGADVVTTRMRDSADWMMLARRGVRRVREAVAAEGRTGEVSVAFAVGAAIDGPEGLETARLLGRGLAAEPPDLLLVDGLSVLRPSLFEAVGALVDAEIPVWLSFGRCRAGLCGVHGQHWGGPEGDAFGRAAARFERLGVGALLVGGIPADHVDGMVAHLRDFTDLPLGVQPRAGDAAELARRAPAWRAEGAQIVGGAGPEQIEAIAGALAAQAPEPLPLDPPAPAAIAPEPWIDGRGRSLYPLPLPELAGHGDVFRPTQGSFLVWRHLQRRRVGRGARCLDVGCGSGLQAIQLALNGARHVRAIDVDPDAVALTLTNAFRNGVADRVAGAAHDLFAFAPEERYDVIVASLYQTPVDPHDATATHRPADFWGRSAIDRLLSLLPDALAPDGAAYVLHLSILSQQRTAELLERHGLQARVVDFGFLELGEPFRRSAEQIERVERLSDAYHVRLGGAEAIVAYLLEIRAAPASAAPTSSREAIRSLR